MNTPFTPDHFHLAPTIAGIELNCEVASDLTRRVLTEVPRRRVIDSMRDGGARLMVDLNSSFVESPGYVFGETDLGEDEKIVDIILPGADSDDSQVYAAFMQGVRQTLFKNPNSTLNTSAVDRARYKLLAYTRPLTPLLRRIVE